ncbi:hypothetical protein MCEZEM1_03425 [Comamonadaceae bacterium]
MGMRAPEHENHTARSTRYRADDCIREGFPATACMARGLPLLHRQAGVEQQDTPICPRQQAALRDGKAAIERERLARQFFENIAQRRRHSDSGRHRKSKAFRLAAAMVRVLPEDDHSDGVQRRELQRTQWLRRKNDRARRQTLPEECEQPLAHSAREKWIGDSLPTRMNRPPPGISRLQLRARKSWPAPVIRQQRKLHAGQPNSASSASPGSGARMNASPTRNAFTPAAPMRKTSSRV